jgi:hypothetical protein
MMSPLGKVVGLKDHPRKAQGKRKRKGGNGMMQKYGYGLSTTRGGVAWALHEWHAALDAANDSVEVEIYACAAELVVEWLQEEKSFDGLLSAFFYPDLELTRLITELCTEGEILLQPHVLMGASCALRLRQLVASHAH